MAPFGSQWAETLIELPTLTFHHALLPLSIFSALDGIRVAMAYRQAIEAAADRSLKDGTGVYTARAPWGQSLLSILIMALGGGSSASMSSYLSVLLNELQHEQQRHAEKKSINLPSLSVSSLVS
jgi:hypothetical protein